MTIPSSTRLLVIDQDTLGKNFLIQMLDQNSYEITKVRSSVEGIRTSRSWKPDIIIINLMQPSKDGWKLCRKLREVSLVPILVLATVSDPNSIAHWLDAGADDYLTKPFSSTMLTAHLKKLTRRIRITQKSTPLAIIR